MAKNIELIVFPVTDAEKAKEFFGKFLETDPYVDSEYYIGYKVGNLEVGLDPNSKLGPISYIDVDDIKASIGELTDAGAEIVMEPREVGGGLLVAQMRDIDGNILGLRQES